jgi:hypothetical protein
VTDIREKVVEEPLYGRVVTERESASPQWPEGRPQQQAIETPEPDHERDQAPDKELDR